MNHKSQDILREVLLEYMEAEAAQVPSTEELVRQHTFSERFLKRMKLLLAQEEGTARGTDSEKMPVQDGNDAKSGFFRKIAGSRTSLRAAAACIVCVVVLGAGWMIYRGTGGLTTSDSSATDTAAESEVAATEETTDAAEESEAASGDADRNDAGTDDAGLDDGTFSAAQAEIDLEGLSVTVSSCTARSMELALTNETGAEIYYGSYYTIEIYDAESGTWEAAEQRYDGVFKDLVYIVRDGETATLTVDWSDLYGELGEGTWRLTKEVQSEDEEFHTLTVVFEI
ncbi:MAG: hypothetical protein LUF32_03535 [Clostridiales bacterium]|nr:hypothetical protein [Clostridiales bacterium]